VSATAGPAADQSPATRLGFKPGQLVQEFGYDDDVDQALREAVENVTGEDLLDENEVEVVDAVLLWWREDDGDLVDAFVDAGTNLAEGGFIWLLTPKSGRPGHVEPSDIEESAPTAGLHATSSISACPEWSGTRLVTPKAGKR
jgi:hypothetical protein